MLPLQPGDDLGVAPLQHSDRASRGRARNLATNQPHTGRRTAPDLMLAGRAGLRFAKNESQQLRISKDFLQVVQDVPHRRRRWERDRTGDCQAGAGPR